MLNSGVTCPKSQEADHLLDRAFLAKSRLLDHGEAMDVTEDDQDGKSELELEEDSFDRLVPGYFR